VIIQGLLRMVWNPGQPLFGGRYFIERKLGEGGVGITYLARNQSNQLRVIKTLKEEILNDRAWKPHREKLRQDFRSEAVRLAVCRHPHVVQIENIFDEYDLPCMVMEYIEGDDLGQILKFRGILSETEALLYIRQISEALIVIHAKGLLHRDIKPRNIMIRTGKLEAVLIDFGIAREFVPGLIQRHTVYRTPGFAPPEQYQLEAPRGEYIDVYGLAATLYTLLTGIIPTSADQRDRNISLEAPITLNPSISASVNQAIMHGMSMQPQYRPQSVREWLDLFSSSLDNSLTRIPTVPIHQFKPIPTVVTSIAPQQIWECAHTIKAHNSMVYAVAISPDGEIIASGSSDRTIKMWELRTGRKLRHLGRWFSGHTESVWTLAFSPDGQTLASGSWDSTIKLWQVSTGKRILTINAHPKWVNSVTFSPDGQILASSSADCTIKLWQVSTGREIRTFTGHTDSVASVAFSPDGQILASASNDCTIKLWHVNTGREIHTLSGHSFFVNSAIFDREGENLVSASSDTTIKFWEVTTGKQLHTLKRHSATVSSIALSRDAQILVSGSWDNTIKLWHVDTAKEICTLQGHESYIRAVAISPDGKTIVSASDDDTIKIWH
jgi:WD40 repeat protein/tRNA A-37 threonylcarbamoyl transferase component Bud32